MGKDISLKSHTHLVITNQEDIIRLQPFLFNIGFTLEELKNIPVFNLLYEIVKIFNEASLISSNNITMNKAKFLINTFIYKIDTISLPPQKWQELTLLIINLLYRLGNIQGILKNLIIINNIQIVLMI